MYVEVCVSSHMYVMYVCWSMCKLSDVCNVCMLKYVCWSMYVIKCMLSDVCMLKYVYIIRCM